MTATPSFIYVITNLINGKRYVGKTICPKQRWEEHKRKSLKPKYPISFAIRNYGKINFSFEVVDSLSSEEEAYRAETQWILLLCSNIKEFGYNCNIGGKGSTKPSEETLTKMIVVQNSSEIVKAKSEYATQFHKDHPEWARDRMLGNTLRRGITLTNEVKEKISKSLTGRKFTEEHKQKMSIAGSGEKHSHAKLKEAEVIEIRKAIKLLDGSKESKIAFIKEIAKRYNVNYSTILDIYKGKTWVHLL